MGAAFGQSLAETDPLLAEKARAVIDYRNAVAHGEEQLPQAGVRPGEALRAAYDVIVLLQGAPSNGRATVGRPRRPAQFDLTTGVRRTSRLGAPPRNPRGRSRFRPGRSRQ